MYKITCNIVLLKLNEYLKSVKLDGYNYLSKLYIKGSRLTNLNSMLICITKRIPYSPGITKKCLFGASSGLTLLRRTLRMWAVTIITVSPMQGPSTPTSTIRRPTTTPTMWGGLSRPKPIQDSKSIYLKDQLSLEDGIFTAVNTGSFNISINSSNTFFLTSMKLKNMLM